MFRTSLICIFFCVLTSAIQGQPVALFSRIGNSPDVNGRADDLIWNSCPPMTGFQTYKPYHGRPVSFPTSFKLAYTDRGIYILAAMSDPHPDSILRQLGMRDDELNADYVGIAFDTYGNQGDAYYFQVTASGVQTDYRRSDETYDAVWRSAVQIHDSGWVAELFIPYAAIRFPAVKEQNWNLQAFRYIRRYREFSQWALEEKGSTNELAYWGKSNGLSGINAPLRLSLTPFAAWIRESQPGSGEQEEIRQQTLSGGLDLKLGLSEAFTLDLAMLPDFSQVRSDDQVKNLTAYETEYDENRPFFNEGVDLFKRGGLFYSRRIGREPALRRGVLSMIDSTETLKENPDRVKLLNAVKVSGRNSQGLAMGFFNAVTSEARAIAADSSGNERYIVTEPLANYNIIVADQQFKGTSSVYLINTNVLRQAEGRDANVTGIGMVLTDKNSVYQVSGSGALSQIHFFDDEKKQSKQGYQYGLEFSKIKGKIHFNLSHERTSKEFNINDMGLIHRTWREENRALISHRVYEPTGPFLEMRNTIEWLQAVNLQDRSNELMNIYLGGYFALRNYLSVWYGGNYAPLDRHDFYEPRTAGRFYVKPGYINGNIGFSTDYRKQVALDGQFYIAKDFTTYRETQVALTPIVRINDRLSFSMEGTYNRHQGVRGYVKRYEGNQILFGERSMHTVTNSLNARYMFKADLSVSVWIRHYWQEGHYGQFFLLRQDGHLQSTTYTGNHDYNFNAFNLDLAANWVFAPGSLLSVVWKSALLDENQDINLDYLQNLRLLADRPHASLWSVKFIYYLDYMTLFHGKTG